MNVQYGHMTVKYFKCGQPKLECTVHGMIKNRVALQFKKFITEEDPIITNPPERLQLISNILVLAPPFDPGLINFT